MAMNMQRAFHPKMLVALTLVSISAGSFNDDNDWVAGTSTESTIYGRLITGNKFSQFDVGISKRIEDGGTRLTDYRSLYIKDIYTFDIELAQIVHKGKLYNILQETDETVFGFRGFLLEASEEVYV